jgi:hypothetical protein
MRDRVKYINQPLVLQFSRLLEVAFLSLLLSACGSTEAPVPTSSSVNAGEINDLAIANAVYFDERTPDDFYHEELQDDAFYSISNVKNVDLLPIVNRGGLPAYELVSDDYVEAMGWSEQAAGYDVTYKQLVDNNETMLYQQFTRVDPASPEFIQLHRVIKASVLDRTGVDDYYKGRITIADMTAAQVKLILEYLWTFTYDNNTGNAVLLSDTTETDDEFIHIMQQARLHMSYTESCDTIEVYDIRYTVEKASGFIWKNEVLTSVISAKRSGDRIEICH